ncbi:MAG: hypothetical protein JXQ68_00320 [Campylobacterales bacterium]|nr:hypothetical protein [Campylobacterales bacterium]
MSDEAILEQVLLLAILKKEPNESIEDVLKMLEEAHAMSLNEGKEIVDRLEKEGAIVAGKLSFLGIAMANEAQRAFSLGD